MIRTQIQLTEEQYRALRQRTQRENLSLSAAIRSAIDLWLSRSDRDELVRRSISSLGSFRSGRNDVSERHDEYLADAYGGTATRDG